MVTKCICVIWSLVYYIYILLCKQQNKERKIKQKITLLSQLLLPSFLIYVTFFTVRNKGKLKAALRVWNFPIVSHLSTVFSLLATLLDGWLTHAGIGIALVLLSLLAIGFWLHQELEKRKKTNSGRSSSKRMVVFYWSSKSLQVVKEVLRKQNSIP